MSFTKRSTHFDLLQMFWIIIYHSIYVVLIWCISSRVAVCQVARWWRAGLSRRRPDVRPYGSRLNSNPDLLQIVRHQVMSLIELIHCIHSHSVSLFLSLTHTYTLSVSNSFVRCNLKCTINLILIYLILYLILIFKI